MELYNLINHEDACGSRTENCEFCGNFILIKNFPEHLVDCQQIENELKSYKKSSNSSDAFKTRRSSYNEDFNKVHHISYVFSKDSEKRMKVNEEKLIFKGSPNLCENKKIGPLEFKQNHA